MYGFLLILYAVLCSVESLSLFFLLLFYLDLYVLGDYASIKGSVMRTKHLFFLIHIKQKGEVRTVPSNMFTPSSNFLTDRPQGGASFVERFCDMCFVSLCNTVMSILSAL